MERWVEYYTELYARENVVSEDALNAIERLPELEELDREPTIEDSTKPWTLLPLAKHQGKTVFPLKY